MFKTIQTPPTFKVSYYANGKLQIKRTLVSYAGFYAHLYANRAYTNLEARIYAS